MIVTVVKAQNVGVKKYLIKQVQIKSLYESAWAGITECHSLGAYTTDVRVSVLKAGSQRSGASAVRFW